MHKGGLQDLKIAICYDRVNKFGGAERVLLSLSQMFPDAPIYTLVHDPKRARWSKDIKVVPTFINKIPFLRFRHELLAPFASLLFETHNLTKYDLVISVTSESAKAVITKPETLHVCLCLTPTRYLWSGINEYKSNPGMGILSPLVKKILHMSTKYLQREDLVTSTRPDAYLAISKEVQNRIKRYYNRDSTVVYPPVDYDYFSSTSPRRRSYYLFVGRLVPYKKAGLVVGAFSHRSMINKQLIVVGSGSQFAKIRRQATPNITFLRDVDDEQLRDIYSSARALIFPSDEDFGIVPLEAQSAGTPVLAYRSGGALETVIDGKTGLFFDKQTPGAIIDSVKQLESNATITSIQCQNNAKKFSNKNFQKLLFANLEAQWQKHQKTYT